MHLNDETHPPEKASLEYVVDSPAIAIYKCKEALPYTSKLLCIRLPKFPVCHAHTTVLDNQCQSYVV